MPINELNLYSITCSAFISKDGNISDVKQLILVEKI